MLISATRKSIRMNLSGPAFNHSDSMSITAHNKHPCVTFHRYGCSFCREVVPRFDTATYNHSLSLTHTHTQTHNDTEEFLFKNNCLVLIKTPIRYIVRKQYLHIMWHCNIQYSLSLRNLRNVLFFSLTKCLSSLYG